MANENQVLTFKLVIDGKESVGTIQLTKREVEDLNTSINKIQDRPILKQFARDLLLVNASAEEATTGIMDFIKWNEMTEPEIQSVINTLREEQRVLAVGSAQWKYHGQAIDNMSNAYLRMQAQQRAFTGASNAARMAVGQFGFALGDASMIAVDFRMFLMSIGNNIPFIVQGLAQVSQEAKEANMSFGAFLKNNLDMSMKLVLGANALMFALQVLPAIFSKIDFASDEAAKNGLKNFTEQMKNMTSDQILDQLEKVRKKIKEINDLNNEERKKNMEGQQTPSSIVGGLGPSGFYSPKKTLRDSFKSDEEYESAIKRENEIKEAETLLNGELNQRIQNNEILLNQIKTIGGLKEEDYKREFANYKTKLSAEEQYQIIVDRKAKDEEKLSDLNKSTKEREEDRKKAAEEQQKREEDARKKQDEYIKGIAEQYQLKTELNQLDKTSNSANIKETRELIANAQKMNLTLEQQLELKKLLNDIDKGWEKDRWKVSPDKPESSKEYDEVQKKLKKLQEQSVIDSKTNVWEKEKAIDEQKRAEEEKYYIDSFKNKTITEADYLKAMDLIKESYARKEIERDKEVFLKKIDALEQTVSAIQDSFSTLYNAMEENASQEVNAWKDKEDKKIETERESALKHARTQAQREKINEQYDKRRDKLEEEADKKAREKLAVWFALKKAGDIATATMSTYTAANNAYATVPFPFNYVAAAAMIAAGLTNVAVIAQQKMPGYARGGAIVGEEGPEIIAPFQDYASGQSKLIAMTMMTLRDELRSSRGSSNSGFGLTSDYGDIKAALNKLNKHLDDGIKANAYLSDREARRVENRGKALNRRNRL